MTLRFSTILVLATVAAASTTPAFAEKNTGITASLQDAMAKTASAFCDGIDAWADAVGDGMIVTAGGHFKPSPVPRDDKKFKADHDAANQIRNFGRSMGCPV